MEHRRSSEYTVKTDKPIYGQYKGRQETDFADCMGVLYDTGAVKRAKASFCLRWHLPLYSHYDLSCNMLLSEQTTGCIRTDAGLIKTDDPNNGKAAVSSHQD